ncbi:MAG: CarD family transcriptional regulator [Polyangiaceae bacterium]|nr:CarD family transcriptional regulator [Polyangiaceae bacterium]
MQPSTTTKLKVGDKRVYPSHGVGEVVRIEEMEIAGKKQFFYVLQLLGNSEKVKVPVTNAGILRDLIGEEEIQDLFDILKDRPVKASKESWNRLHRGYLEKFKTGSIYDIAEVMRDLYRKKQNEKQISNSERTMLEKAEKLIVSEIAIARKQKEDKVKSDIETILQAN